jgi:LacI family transcriptional regulator
MAKGKRPTIRDVAAASGVSIQTVSRVINSKPDVSADTVERVQEVIRELGYSPNLLARSLIVGRSHLLGVVAYGLEYFGPSHIVVAVERQAAELGFGISLNLILEPETDAIDHLFDTLRSRQVDGIIWAIPEVGHNRAWSDTTGRELPVPLMLVGGMAGKPRLPSVAIDNVAIGRLATEHLLAGGARRIGIVTGPLSWCESQQRLDGWRQTIEAAGREAEERLIFEGDWTVSNGESALYRLLADCPELDAVFASNDQMALGVLHAAHTLGRKVPDELSVVGVDNIPEASHFWPPLTTVDQPLDQAGALAVKRIGKLINTWRTRGVDEPAPEATLLQPTLVIRESSRRPPSERPVAERPEVDREPVASSASAAGTV